MSDSYIWGNLNRSVVDPTLIDEAITDAVEAHNGDPNAHFGPDGALESHRMSEIIDHRAESIVNDKLQPKTRAWTAIVDSTSEYDFKTIEGAVEYVNSQGGGSIFIKRGRYPIQNYTYIGRKTELHGEGMGESIIYSAKPAGVTLNFAGGEFNGSYNYTYVNFKDNDDYYEDWSSGLTSYMELTEEEALENARVGDKFFVGGDSKVRIITEIVGYGIVKFTPKATPTGLDAEIKTFYKLKFTNGSDKVACLGNNIGDYGWDDTRLSLFDTDGKLIATTKSYDHPSQSFTLEDKWNEATTLKTGYAGEGTGEKNNISALTFEGESNPLYCSIFTNDLIEKTTVEFNECEFTGSKHEFNLGFDERRLGILENCKFKITKTGNMSALKNVRVDRCEILFEKANAQVLDMFGKCVVTECLISNEGYPSAKFLNVGEGEVTITESTIKANGSVFFGMTNLGSTIITDCRLEILSTNNFSIRGRQVIVADSIINAKSSGRLIISGTETRLSMLGNISSHAITTTGITRKIEQNLIGAI